MTGSVGCEVMDGIVVLILPGPSITPSLDQCVVLGRSPTVKTCDHENKDDEGFCPDCANWIEAEPPVGQFDTLEEEREFYR